jgi:crossover junction endodeoxyribonuclease RuvC
VLVLGVDPSTVATGWGIVDGDSRAARAVDFGVIRPSTRLPLCDRLATIHEELRAVLAREPRPAVCVLESAFVARNAKTALALGQVRGVILLATVQAEIPFVEYSATEIKRAAVGYGTAGKEQVAVMIARILGLGETPPSDAADALGAAWCHLNRAARPAAGFPR